MGKKDNIKSLVLLAAKGLCHKIGSTVNKKDIYSEKYRKESENFINLAKDISQKENWNSYDKANIKIELERKLRFELERKDFLDEKKFDYIDSEIIDLLKNFGLN